MNDGGSRQVKRSRRDSWVDALLLNCSQLPLFEFYLGTNP